MLSQLFDTSTAVMCRNKKQNQNKDFLYVPLVITENELLDLLRKILTSILPIEKVQLASLSVHNPTIRPLSSTQQVINRVSVRVMVSVRVRLWLGLG